MQKLTDDPADHYVYSYIDLRNLQAAGGYEMAHTLTIKLPDEIYEYACEMARKAGQSPAEWVVDRVEAITPRAVFLTPAERAEAMAKLMRHAGAVSVPDPTNADNEAIDRDLVEEYGSTHEDDK